MPVVFDPQTGQFIDPQSGQVVGVARDANAAGPGQTSAKPDSNSSTQPSAPNQSSKKGDNAKPN